MSLKENAKTAARKTLQTVDKGLKWAQDHPTLVERTALVVVTVILTRSAYKKFSPSSIPKLEAFKAVDNYTSNVVNGYETPTGGRIEILRTISPSIYDDVNDAAYVAHLEVRDLDIEDMNNGDLLGMIFNVKDHFGIKNTPIAVMPYQRFMEHVKDGFPIHHAAEDLLKENDGRSQFIEVPHSLFAQNSEPIMDQFFGSKS